MTFGPTTIRIDPDVKKQSIEIFNELGIGMSAAINAFLKAVIRERGIPFELKSEQITREKKSRNASLNRAYLARRDEFYTQYEDIEKELSNYTNFFKQKVVLCNCDDPFESAFFKYFVLNFNELNIKTLICTCYAGSSFSGHDYPLDGDCRAYKVIVNKIPDIPLLRPDGMLDIEGLFTLPENSLLQLMGSGDFRSDECIGLLDIADIVVTNPPFSLFREFITLLETRKKKYIVLGNMNASTCKEIFPLFMQDKTWYGASIHSGDRKFFVPKNYPLNASNCGVDEYGRHYIRVKGVRWFTNLDHGDHHKPISLEQSYDPDKYPKYENYDAIEVNRASRIPKDYYGLMGVPITFLDRYCPEQFEIIMLANGNTRTNVDKRILKLVGYKPHPEDRGGVGIINGERVYARIIIRRRKK